MPGFPAQQQEIIDACFHPSGDFAAFAKKDVEQAVSDRFEKIVRAQPGRLAVKGSDREFTYLELNRAANHVARAILERGKEADEPVAVLFEHSAAVVAAILGVLKAHKFYVPLDPAMPRERLATILADCGATMMVTNRRNFDLASELSPAGTIINADDLSSDGDNIGLSIPATALEALFYTSGSTGRPKGVLYNHRSTLHNCMVYTNYLHLCIHDRLTLLRSCSFAASMQYLWGALLNGAGLYVYSVRQEGLERLARWLTDEGITLYHQGAAEFRYFMDTLDDEDVFTDLRVLKLGSQQATRADIEWFKRHTTPDCVLLNTFNATEAGSMLFYLVNHEMASIGATVPLGFPVDMKVTLRDERGAEVKPGEVGEIAAESDYLSSGYWQQPELTRAKFLPAKSGQGSRTYLTGDLGRRLPDGCIEYVGRADFRVKIRGYTVEPSEVETRLMEHPGISEAAVVARDDPYGQSMLVGYCVPKTDPAPNASMLRAFLQTTLPEYMIPARFIMLETMPLTPNGKFDRSALPLPEESRPEVASEFLPPRNAIEEQLTRIWSEVLGVDPVGVNDHFLELGGHSLAATQVISRIRTDFQLELPFTRLFEMPRIADLAQWLETELAGKKDARIANARASRKTGPQRGAGTQPIAPTPRSQPFPASFAQQRLWFLDQLIPENPVYNEPHHMRLHGHLDIVAFRRSLSEIVRRHEVLRTSFVAVDGKPFQVIAAPDETPFELPVVDLTLLGELHREQVVRDLARLETRRIFDLGENPLFRTALLRVSSDEHVWLFTLHHIVADGWSMEILVRELTALYQAFSTHGVAPLPELPIQYRDFAVWQREQFQAGVMEGQLRYWREKLKDAPPELALPVDRPRPPVQTNRGKQLLRNLPEVLSNDLKKLSLLEGVTPFMTLLAAFQTLLHRYSGQEDILVAIPVASRNHVEIEGLIGFFVNMLVLRTDLSGAPSFRELLERVRKGVLDAQSNQGLPAEKLLEELRLEREMSRTPLTQVAFAYREPQRNYPLPGLTLSRLDIDPGTAKTDLNLFISDGPRGFTATFEYNTDVFDASTIERMLENFQALLESIVEDAERRITMLPPFRAEAQFDGQRLEAAYASSNLTRNQILIWLGQKLDPQATTYNIGFTVELPLAIDWARFRRVTQRLINGCDALRTVIRDVHGVPEQTALTDFRYDVPLVDLSELPMAALESRARAQELCQHRFVMEERLFESVLFKQAEEGFLWYLGMHHIIADGWSVWLLGKHLSGLYEQELAGTAGETVILPAFREYLNSERQQRLSARYLKAKTYWEQKLLTGAEPLSIYGNAQSRTTRAKRLSFELGPERTRHLRALAQREAGSTRTLDASVFEVFATLVCVYLTRVGAGRRLCLGTPFHNRRTKAAKETIGSFLEVLPLRVIVDENDTFASLRTKVRTEIGETMRHSRYTVSNPEHKNYDVLVNYQLVGKSDFAGTPLTAMEWLHPGTQDVSMAFQLYDFARSDSFRLSFDFRLDVLEEQQESRAVQHFLHVVDALIEDPARSISTVDLCTSEERDFLLLGFNRPAAIERAPLDFMEAIESQAAITPDRMAVNGAGGALTYSELNTRANQLAHHLVRAGVGADVPVGLCMRRSLEALIGVLGILKAGGAYVPLDPAHPRERLTSMVRNCAISVILAEAETKEAVNVEPSPRIICLDEDGPLICRESVLNPTPTTSGDNLVYVIHTSGSTGQPKGTGVHRRGFSNLLEWFVGEHAIASSDSVLLITSLGFDLLQKNLFAPLMRGGMLHLYPEGYDPRAIIRAIAEQEISWLNCTPSAFYPLVEQGSEHHPSLASLRYLFLGGEPIAVRRLRQWNESERTQVRVVNTYGPTECTDVAGSFVVPDIDQYQDKSIPLGQPIWKTQLYVLDPELQLEPIGVPGELCIAGEGVGRGYLDDAVRTAEKFMPNPFADHPGQRLYRSGDLAHHRRVNGQLEYLGRMDHQVKVRGFRVELGEIEAVLEEHPGVREAVVLARQDQRQLKTANEREGTDATGLTAYICGAANGALEPEPQRHGTEPLRQQRREGFVEDLRRFLEGKLPAYMVPHEFVLLDALPLTPNGKVDRKALPEPDGLSPDLGQAYVDPRTETEKLLASIWRETLGVERVGIHDSFFELGGHSLLATQVISRVNAAFDLTVPLRKLFESPTVAQLAKIVNATQTSATPRVPPLVPVPRHPKLPLSFAQQRLWFLDQYMPGTAIYNIPLAVRLQGEVQVEALEKSLNEVVRRHEALRTTFRAVRGDPYQVIASNIVLELPLVNITGLSAKRREAEVLRLGREEALRRFDLSRGPLIRARLVKLGQDEHVWFLTMHHIVSDGWSIDILMHDFGALYEALTKGKAAELPELPIQYADFAVWQREWLRGKVLEEHLSYWREKLKRAPLEFALPMDRPRPAVQTFRGARESLRLPNSLKPRVEDLSRREESTLFMTLLAAFQVLLCRYSSQEDIVVGTPIANRNRVEIEGLIGFFVNMLAIRTDLSGNPTFREVLRRVREVTLGAYAHQDLPVEKLVEELRLERKLDRPFVQVTFALQNMSEERRKFSGLTLEALGVERGLTQTDLTLSVQDTGEGLRAGIRYSTDLFDARTITRMLGDYRKLLEEVVANPKRRIATLPPFSATEGMRGGQLEDIYEQSNLTRNQLLIWLGQQLHPEAPLYNLTTTLTIRGPVDVEHFRAAFASLVRSNDALRTVIEQVHGLPQQKVLADLPHTVEYVDFSQRLEAEDEFERWVEARCQKVFELDRCLFDSVLVKLSSGKHVWYLNQHHLVSDGWSVWLMCNRMAELYKQSVREELAGRKVEFPSYREYVDFERAYRRSARYRRDEAYWREKLAQGIEPNVFYGRSIVGGSPRVATVPWELGPVRSNKLRAAAEAFLGRADDTALSNMFAGLLLTYLYRFGGKRRLSLGTVFHNRLSRFRETQGMFLQMLPLRLELEEGETFLTLMAKIAMELRRSLRHGQYAVSNPVQDRAYDVVLNYHNMRNEVHRQFNGSPMDARVVPTGRGEDGLALRVMDLSGSGDFTIDFDFRCDLFDELQRVRTIGYFEKILDTFLADPQCALERVDLLSREERERVVVDFNRTTSPFPEKQALPRLFEAQVEKTPDRVAASCDGISMTYAQLNARANQLARYLCQHGVGPDTLVGILMARSVDMLVSILGVLKAGGAYVPLDPNYPERRLALMISNSGISVLLTRTEFKIQGRSADPEPNTDKRTSVLNLDEHRAAIAQQSSARLPARADPRNLSYVIYTSGSTGVPKGAMVEHRGMINHLYAKIAELGLSEEDIVAQTASQCFDISVWQFLVASLVGARVHIFEDDLAFNALRLPDALVEQEITIFETVPSLLGAMLPRAMDARLCAVRFLLVTGEAVPSELCRQWFNTYADIPVLNAYGPTECSDDVTHYLIDAPPAEDVTTVPIGHPLANTRLYITNRNAQLRPFELPGELWVGGAGVGRGYHGDCAKTAELFVPDPFSMNSGDRLYRTGDLARYLKDGHIEFLGRLDHQVKVRGFRIELGEIEAVLRQHPWVREAVAVAQTAPSSPDPPNLIAYVVGGANQSLDVTELRAFLLARLPDYMVPPTFVSLEKLPLTANGKVDRRALPEPDDIRPLRETAGNPRDALELRLVQLWEEVLGVQSVGIRDNFFELGGHSLLAVRLMARLEQQFGKSLPLPVLFQTPTVESLAQLLRREIEIDKSSLVCIQSRGEKSPFFCVHPAHGNVLCYYELAHCMGQDRPFYGLQAEGLDTEEARFKSIEELAAYYIEAIQQVKPRGPYLLGGWSSGGTVAFEMARQLTSRGELVAELVLIDSYAPAVSPVRVDDSDDRRLRRRLRAAAEHLLDEPADLRVKLDSLLDQVRETGVSVPEVGLADAKLYLNMMKLASRYTPQPSAASATLLKATESAASEVRDDLGWRDLVEGGLTIHVVPGSHFDMVQKPHVEELADQLHRLLDRADRSEVNESPAAQMISPVAPSP